MGGEFGVGDSDWEVVKDLAVWRGTTVGCYADGLVTRGACSGNAIATGSAVGAQEPVTLNRWRSGNIFCALKTDGSRF